MSLRTLITGALIGLSVSCTDTDELEHCGQPYRAEFAEVHPVLEALAQKAMQVTTKTPAEEVCDLLEKMNATAVDVFRDQTWVRKEGKSYDFYKWFEGRVLSDVYIPGKEFEVIQGLQCYRKQIKLKKELLEELRKTIPNLSETVTMYGCMLYSSTYFGECLSPSVDFDVMATSSSFYGIDLRYEKEYSDTRIRAIMGYNPIQNTKDVPSGEIDISHWVTLGSPFSKDQDFIRNCQEKKNEEWFTYAKELAAFAKMIVERKE